MLPYGASHSFAAGHPPRSCCYLVFYFKTCNSTLLKTRSVCIVGITISRGGRDTRSATVRAPKICKICRIVFDIPLRHLTAQGITFSAYVDDMAAPARVKCSQQVADAVQKALSMIGCQINVIKSEALPLVRPPPPPPSLPQYLMPPLPVQTCGPSPWQTRPSPMPAEWANSRSHRFAGVSHLMHLGHPLPAFLDIKAAY